MKDFQFDDGNLSNQKIEEIINFRRRKIVGQQVIFSSILFVILCALALFITKRIVYSEFDGYIQTDYVNLRAWDDIYVIEQFTQEGEIVHPGDTLYSYLYLSNIINSELLYSEHDVILDDRNMRLQTEVAELDANVLRVRINELRNQIEQEERNIQFGLSDNSHKMDLQRQLAETQEQLTTTLDKIDVYHAIGLETRNALQRSGLQYSDDRDNVLVNRMKKTVAIRYVLAEDTAVVTKKWTPSRMPVFKGDPVLQLQNMDLKNCNMRVMAYIPTNDMRKVSNQTKAQIIVNDDISFIATVQLLGARTEPLPNELRNSLSHIYTAVMVVFRPDPGQTLPFWAVVDRVPVRVKIKKFGPDVTTKVGDWWYVNGDGTIGNFSK